MMKKADGHYRNRSIENNTRLINTRIRRGVLFSFQRVKTEFFFPVYTYIPFIDPIYFSLSGTDEFREISKNTFFTERLRWLLLKKEENRVFEGVFL